MNTVINNLISLAKEGAFGNEEKVAPMSQFKWDALNKLANIEDVAPYVSNAIARHAADKLANIPPRTREKFSKDTFTGADGISASFNIADTDSLKLSYPLKRYLLKDIAYKERHSIDTSKVSLDLLSLILQNTNIILRGGIRLRGIIELGLFLRTKGQNVDFVKVESWLQKLKLRRMASLQASVLISLFSFEEAEFPYIKKVDPRAGGLAMASLERAYTLNRLERAPGKYNIRNCITFGRYSRSEALCKATSTIVRSISEIEE